MSSKNKSAFGAWFAATFETVGDGLVIIDRKGTVQMVNPACEALFGYAAEEIVGRNIKIVMPSPYHEEHDGYLADYHRTGERKVIGIGRQVEGLRKDGSVFPIQLSVGEMAYDGEPMFIGVLRDTSDQAKAIEQLSRAEERTRAIVETVIDGIVTIDRRGTIVTVNPAVERIFGYGADELIGQNVRMLMPSSFAERHDEYLKNYLSSGDAQIIGIGREVEGQRKDGSTFPMDLAVGEMAQDGERMFTGIIRDVTERHAMQQQLQEQTIELARSLDRERRLNEQQREFISMASHEFRTPLSIIDAARRRLSRLGAEASEAERDEWFGTIHDMVVRISDLVDGTLNAAKLDAGKLVLEPAPVDLKQLLDRTITERQVGDRIDVDLEGLPDQIIGDAILLGHIFDNLLSNAFKYSKGTAGHVAVTGQIVEGEEFVQVMVTDQGIGIPASDLKKVFKRYARASNTTGIAGTGIGLSLVRRMARMHGGDVSVKSREGKGSTFTVTLPCTAKPTEVPDLDDD